MSSRLPLPPQNLAARVGVADGADPIAFYLREGAALRGSIDGMLPGDWAWAGKRVLDFGCGSARVLRHFEREAGEATFIGCDVDEQSIAWDQANLSPPFRFFKSELMPPLAVDSKSLDLIWAMSVFTHIGDSWSSWLLEMHRLLAPGGLLIASYLGEGMWEALVGEPYVEDQVGMTVLGHWRGPDAWVLHSEWWLREHWGRAFDFLEVRRPARSATGPAEIEHSLLLLRKRPVEVTAGELESIDAEEHRELAGLQTSLRLTQRDLSTATAEQREEGERAARLYYESSHSWRLTAPLRKAGALRRRVSVFR
jgi:SAM-dependent methyltransferase